MGFLAGCSDSFMGLLGSMKEGQELAQGLV